MKKTLINLTLFLSLSSCVSVQKTTSFDGDWEIDDHTPPRACLYLEDVERLREILIRCEGTKE